VIKIICLNLALGGFLFLSPLAHGSLSHNEESLEEILNSPEKFEKLKSQGPRVYGNLKKIAFNEDRNMNVRWRAFMTLIQIGAEESIPEVKEALLSNDWFMRDAALKVYPALDSKGAYKAAVEKLKDSSLVVRAAAVDALRKIGDGKCSEKLWEELYSKENYMHRQSLWIRRHVIETLAELSPAGSEERFVKVLDDEDKALVVPAIKGLERLAAQKLGDMTFSVADKKIFWKTWFKQHSEKTATR
jgi:hypothetical protein